LSPAAGSHLQHCVINDVIAAVAAAAAAAGARTNRRNVPTVCLSSRRKHGTSVGWHASEKLKLP